MAWCQANPVDNEVDSKLSDGNFRISEGEDEIILFLKYMYGLLSKTVLFVNSGNCSWQIYLCIVEKLLLNDSIIKAKNH